MKQKPGKTNTDLMNAEVRKDGSLLDEVLELIGAKTPLTDWSSEAVATLSEAMNMQTGNPQESEKADRLRRHLFAGPPPRGLARVKKAAPSRRAERLRADLADLIPYGSGLYLVTGEP